MTTYTKTLKGRAVIRNPAKTKEILSTSSITTEQRQIPFPDIPCAPFGKSDFEDVIFEDIAQDVEILKRPKPGVQDSVYGFETSSGIRSKTRAIVRPITERDARLIEAGYAKIGDFTLIFKVDENVDVHDIVFDLVRNITLDLTVFKVSSAVKNVRILKSFVGVAQTRK